MKKRVALLPQYELNLIKKAEIKEAAKQIISTWKMALLINHQHK